MEDKQVMEMVNKNHAFKAFADRLAAISARRRKGGSFVQKMCNLWRKS